LKVEARLRGEPAPGAWPPAALCPEHRLLLPNRPTRAVGRCGL